MPTNLNALIRYKTINSCLYGGRRKWTISELITACSESLAEGRGRYEPVSERTLRDDIRVLRSDILGFNAPIKQERGLYFYSDSGYSIMNLSLSDSKILDQIIIFLTELRTEVNHPELEILLEKLSKVANVEYSKPSRVQEGDQVQIKQKKIESRIINTVEDSRVSFYKSKIPKHTWADVFKLIIV